jgi:predicted small lipoprotein YifL
MRRELPWLFGIALLTAGWAACGGSVEHGDTELPGADAGVDDAKKDSAKDVVTDKGAGWDVTSEDALPDYQDPGCPDAPPAIIDNQCDPLNPKPYDCPEGEACFPYVIYPSAPCEAEIYGAVCYYEGTGKQGDPCYGEPCASQHVCVVTGAGTVCVRLCELKVPGSCPNGMVCEPIDVLGYGGCL